MRCGHSSTSTAKILAINWDQLYLRASGFSFSEVSRCPQDFTQDAGGGTATMEGRCFAAEARIPKYITRWKRGSQPRVGRLEIPAQHLFQCGWRVEILASAGTIEVV